MSKRSRSYDNSEVFASLHKWTEACCTYSKMAVRSYNEIKDFIRKNDDQMSNEERDELYTKLGMRLI